MTTACPGFNFSSITLSLENPNFPPNCSKLTKPTSRNNPKVQSLMKNLYIFEQAPINATGGRIAGAFTYVCLHPLDTTKTMLQTKGASKLCKNTFDKYDN
ncbi:hypothetical protein NL676_005490 [Syzygium grande]|nr:hypothetical protein NL676_005490 [Syzygium grande]